MKLYELCEYFTSLARSNTEELSIGEDISPIPELKIIFDGYGYDEETETDGSNINIETFAFFVHKDALTDGFRFPEHEQTAWLLIHRPKQEVCIDIFYDVSEDKWEVIFPDDIDEMNNQTYDSVEETLVTLFNRYELD
jgi:hypothetical protein